jgi:hypothetical protein
MESAESKVVHQDIPVAAALDLTGTGWQEAIAKKWAA